MNRASKINGELGPGFKLWFVSNSDP